MHTGRHSWGVMPEHATVRASLDTATPMPWIPRSPWPSTFSPSVTTMWCTRVSGQWFSRWWMRPRSFMDRKRPRGRRKISP
eukprot:923177-Prorocentrum_minimum.AAC.3